MVLVCAVKSELGRGDGTQAANGASGRNFPRRPAICQAAVSEKMTT
jgi:hypothetical protein